MKHQAHILWKKKENENFLSKKYSREHTWILKNGIEIQASSSPYVVPIPLSNENVADPEECFTACISSCHMLFFLSVCASLGYTVESYSDFAEGILGMNSEGKKAIVQVNLKPNVIFSGTGIPDKNQIKQMHETAHNQCYLANSVKSEIKIFT